MRMSNSSQFDASKLVNEYSMEDLIAVFTQYGELRNAHKLARIIIKERSISPIKTTKALVEIFFPIIPKKIFNKTIAKIFRAIRIEVNNELGAIKSFLKQTIDLIKQNGGLFVFPIILWKTA